MATFVPPGGGEIIGDAPDRRVEVLSDHDLLHATWSRFGPRRDGADLHIHHGHTDLFYVLEGELTLRLGADGEEHVLPQGSLARVPPLVVHGFRNGSDDHVRYLNLHAPGAGFIGYMRGLRDRRPVDFDQHEPPADGGRPVTEAVITRGEGTLADVEEIGVREMRVEAGAEPPPRHVHRRHVESFWVLEGEIAVEADGQQLRAQAGSWVQVPPGVAHTVSFPAAARFLDIHSPSFGFGAADEEQS
jgi:quercetin dioxygenase-like cupin family protein